MSKLIKTFEIKVLEKRKDGGRIRINTASVDRDRDRVMPKGARIENYLKNPVVMFGHNYRDFWSTIGKTNALEISEDAIDADFTLRPAANEHDPQNVILLLWEGEWIRTASIGFIPDAKSAKKNEMGGYDFGEWELLEWSVVPIPSNQDALRLAVKGLDEGMFAKRELWDAMHANPETVNFIAETELREVAQRAEVGAWIRTLTVDAGLGEQTLFACFRAYTLDIPEGATALEVNDDGECEEVPHPDAGKTVAMKDCVFVPPLVFDDGGMENAIYSLSGKDVPDTEMLQDELWQVKELSDIQLSLPIAKSLQARTIVGAPVDRLTLRMANRLTRIVKQRHATLAKHFAKRGRVLSQKNEEQLRAAQSDMDSAKSKIDDVLAQLDSASDDEKGLEPSAPDADGNQNQATPNTTDTPALSDERELAELLDGMFQNLKEGLL